MNHDKQPQSNRDAEENILLKQRETFHRLMRECSECQAEVEPDWQICAHCGTRLDTSCPGCGVPLPPAGAQSCPHCGLAIPEVGT
jgi:predicted amidophosphoribosyltransferase